MTAIHSSKIRITHLKYYKKIIVDDEVQEMNSQRLKIYYLVIWIKHISWYKSTLVMDNQTTCKKTELKIHEEVIQKYVS